MEYSKRITDERFIINLFRKLFKLKKVPVVANHVMADMLIKDRRGNEIILENLQHNPLDLNTSMNIGFFYNETFYSFTSSKIFKDSVHYLQKPPEIYATFKRKLSRYEIKDIDNIRMKIGQNQNVLNVKDISIKGLCFESDISFEVGSVINNIEIILEDSHRISMDAVVKYRNTKGTSFIYGLSFTDIIW